MLPGLTRLYLMWKQVQGRQSTFHEASQLFSGY